MKAAIDSAGRLVIPKPLRDALGLVPGQELELRVVDARLEIEVPSTPMRLEKRGRSYVAVPTKRLPPLTTEQVRDALERSRR
jgi:AbrB family looped-hinge helix DNA binding protein